MIAVYCLHAAATFRFLWEVLNNGTLFVYSDRRLMQKDFIQKTVLYIYNVRLFLCESSLQANTFLLFRWGNTLTKSSKTKK